MQDYRVELDAYNGPLDLLLYLVRRHEIDLNDIPIAELTDQYLKHLELIQQIDVNLAGEFLVMAATLLEIKSAMLLPQPEQVDPQGGQSLESIDPRHELVQQLLAYKQFKDAAFELEDRRLAWESRYARSPGSLQAGAAAVSSEDQAADAAPIEIDLEDVHVLDLCEAFGRILETIGRAAAHHEVVYDDTPIALHAEDIVDRLKRDGPMSLQNIFVGRQNRSEMIGLFLAMLELIRQGRLRVWQEQVGAEIRLELRPEEEQARLKDDQPHDWRDPQTGEIQYEWPSEDARQRAERRAKLRLARFQNPDQPPPEDEPLVISDDQAATPSEPADDHDESDGDSPGTSDKI